MHLESFERHLLLPFQNTTSLISARNSLHVNSGSRSKGTLSNFYIQICHKKCLVLKRTLALPTMGQKLVHSFGISAFSYGKKGFNQHLLYGM